MLADGTPPYPVTTRQAISRLQIGRLGLTLLVGVGPANSTAVWLDLTSIK